MKLRLLDDSLRLRLTRSEVARLAATGRVDAVTALPTGSIAYRVETADRFGASLDDGRLVVTVPRQATADWAAADDPVGLYADLPHRSGTLRLAVEKDFACLIPRPDADPADHYPNPKVPRDRP